jgi:hypothetical protein
VSFRVKHLQCWISRWTCARLGSRVRGYESKGSNMPVLGLLDSGCGETDSRTMALSDPGDDFVEVVAGVFAYAQIISPKGDLLWHREHCGSWRSQRNFDLAQESQDLLSVVRIVR